MSDIDVNEELELAQFIRQVNGNNRMGAARLAEEILAWQAARQAPASGEVEPAGWRKPSVMRNDGWDFTADRKRAEYWAVVSTQVEPVYTHPPAKVPEDVKQRLRDAISEALGEALDCTRVWGAWGCGTMSQADFQPVNDDPDRLEELVDAALSVLTTPTPATTPEAEWVKCGEKMPKRGQRVQLFSQGVIQHHMPVLDEDDEGPFWDFEVHDYNPPVDFERDQWRLPPTPPQEQ